MNNSKVAEAEKRLNAKPPELIGLSRKSPITAPSGRVNMNAVQNKSVCEIRVR